MTQSTRTVGIDETLAAGPPLVAPPLSLYQLAGTLIDVPQTVQAQYEALEDVTSAQAAVSAALKQAADERDPVLKQKLSDVAEAAQSRVAELQVWASELADKLASESAWERGFEYLPELGLSSVEIWVPDSATTKSVAATSSDRLWYDPFDVVAHDDRSLFGWPGQSYESRAMRAARSLDAHEQWQMEREFWCGSQIPTNYHLTASPSTPTTSPHRTIPAWPNPTAAPTTTLGTAVGLGQSLASLDQAIANADAGTGMIHATPYLVQLWMKVFPFIRDTTGRIYTVNMNLIVPGYGYPGSGPDVTRAVADGVTNSTTTVTSATATFTALDVGATISGPGIPAGATIVSITNGTTVVISVAATASASGLAIQIGAGVTDLTGSTKQWAYATEKVFSLRGAQRILPRDLRQAGPETNVNNSANIRGEQAVSLLTNRLLRAAVYVDTTTT